MKRVFEKRYILFGGDWRERPLMPDEPNLLVRVLETFEKFDYYQTTRGSSKHLPHYSGHQNEQN